MKESKYKILVDFGGYEGLKWHDDSEYDTVDLAVKHALKHINYAPFFIVRIINWEAKEL